MSFCSFGMFFKFLVMALVEILSFTTVKSIHVFMLGEPQLWKDIVPCFLPKCLKNLPFTYKSLMCLELVWECGMKLESACIFLCGYPGVPMPFSTWVYFLQAHV